MGMGAHHETLRSHLRHATASAHDRLDNAMRGVAGWKSRADYARFLSLQFAVRAPVEKWLADYAPEELIPPPQTLLIARDLEALSVPAARPMAEFKPQTTSEDAIVGAAWVLAGSALGNLSICKEVESAGPADSPWPLSFLADRAMLGFWSGLRRRIEHPAGPREQAEATLGANAVFNHFLSSVEARQPDRVA